MEEAQVERIIQDKGLTAPRLTPQHIDSVIVDVDYYTFPNNTVTVCCLTLINGFTVIGESACVSPRNFDTQVGRTIAYDNARNKIWGLEGYLLRDTLYKSQETLVPEEHNE